MEVYNMVGQERRLKTYCAMTVHGCGFMFFTPATVLQFLVKDCTLSILYYSLYETRA